MAHAVAAPVVVTLLSLLCCGGATTAGTVWASEAVVPSQHGDHLAAASLRAYYLTPVDLVYTDGETRKEYLGFADV